MWSPNATILPKLLELSTCSSSGGCGRFTDIRNHQTQKSIIKQQKQVRDADKRLDDASQ